MTTTKLLTNEVTVLWVKKGEKNVLKFTFLGDLTEESASLALTRWRSEFSKIDKGTKVDLIWNCLEMRKYSGKSAKLWKQAMSAMKDKIDKVWLVTNNTFIRMGAKTVTFLLPIQLNVISSEKEIPTYQFK